MADSCEKDFRSDPKFLYNAYRANLMLLSGRPQKHVDVLFFHNRSFGDYTGLYEMARSMYQERQARFIAITNNEGETYLNPTEPFVANPGKTECIRKLTEGSRILRRRILIPEMKALHTREENTAFLDLSIKEGWESAVILAQPHQVLRPFLGLIQTMRQAGYWMDVYAAAPSSTPWLEEVKGNQGEQMKARSEHIDEELGRIYLRQSTNELASFEQLFAYLEAREQGTLVLGQTERGSDRLLRDLPPNFQGGLTL